MFQPVSKRANNKHSTSEFVRQKSGISGLMRGDTSGRMKRGTSEQIRSVIRRLVDSAPASGDAQAAC